MPPLIARGAGKKAQTAQPKHMSTQNRTGGRTGELNASRGIQNTRITNAQSRFEDQAFNRLTSTQLQNTAQKNPQSTIERSGSRGFESDQTQANSKVSKNQDYKLYNANAVQLTELREIGGNFDDSDEVLTVTNIPKNPPFPFAILSIALLKDLLDIPATLVILGIPFSMALSFVLALVLFFWILGKIGGGWWKKKVISWLWKRYILTIVIEILPFFSMIPATTIFVLMAHYHETKTVKLLNLALEKIRNGGI